MTIPLTGAGSLFVKLGHIFGAISDANAYRGTTANARVLSGAVLNNRLATMQGDYANGTAEYSVVDGLVASITSQRSSQGQWISYLGSGSASLAARTLIDMANTDTPLSQQTLAVALQLLINQMVGASASVNATTISFGSQTNGSNPTPVGTPIIVLSGKNADGTTQQYGFTETLTFRCTGDSNGSATAFQEPVQATGQGAVGDTLGYQWPGGSGATANLVAVDSTQNNSAGNLLWNATFATFTTTNVPDNWTITVGAATTNVFQGSSGYRDSSSLQITGDGGSTLTALTQQFNTAPTATVGGGGTTGKLSARGVYALNCWIKCSATPSAGVLEFSLVDGSGTTIADDQSANNLFTKSLTAVSTSWVNVNGVFRLPLNISSTVKLKIRLSTAIDSGKSVFVDDVSLNPMTALYAGGPYCSVFSGSTKMVQQDNWTIAVTVTAGTFQSYFERAFSMRALGMSLPSNVSPTVADSLVI